MSRWRSPIGNLAFGFLVAVVVGLYAFAHSALAAIYEPSATFQPIPAKIQPQW